MTDEIKIIGIEEPFLVRIQEKPEVYQEAMFAMMPDHPESPGTRTLRVRWGKVK